MILTPEQDQMLNDKEAMIQGFNLQANRWPHGLIPYELDASLSKYSLRLPIKCSSNGWLTLTIRSKC